MTGLVAADTSQMSVRFAEELAGYGTTPAPFNAAELRVSAQSLNFDLKSIASTAMRADRMVDDVVLVDADISGGFDFEIAYGVADEILAAGIFCNWSNTPTKDNAILNNLTAISAITGTTTFTLGTPGGSLYPTGALVQSTGFTAGANNGVNRVASNTPTTVVTNGAFTAEAATTSSKLKVVGFQGAANADVQAVLSPTSLISTTLDFTTFGLIPGQWVKLGGAAVGSKFAAVPAMNGYCRILSVAAHTLTFDIVPAGWATDTTAAINLKVWFGDTARNGTIKRSFSVERAHLDINQYFLFNGLIPQSADLKIQTGQLLKATLAFLGGASPSPTGATATASVKAAPSTSIMNAVTDVPLILVAGAAAGTIQSANMMAANNLRGQKAISVFGNAGVGIGQFNMSGSVTAYFTDGTAYGQARNSTPFSFGIVFQKNNQTFIQSVPRAKFDTVKVNAGSINTDCTLALTYKSMRDPTYNFMAGYDRLTYVE